MCLKPVLLVMLKPWDPSNCHFFGPVELAKASPSLGRIKKGQIAIFETSKSLPPLGQVASQMRETGNIVFPAIPQSHAYYTIIVGPVVVPPICIS